MSVVAQNLLVRAQPCLALHTFREEFGSSSKGRSTSWPGNPCGRSCAQVFSLQSCESCAALCLQRERLLVSGWENARAVDMMKVYSFLPQADVKRYHFGTPKSSSGAISRVLPVPLVQQRGLQAGSAQGDTTLLRLELCRAPRIEPGLIIQRVNAASSRLGAVMAYLGVTEGIS